VRTSASTAAAAIRTAAKIIDFVDPASALIKVGTAGARIALPAIADLVKSVDLSKIDIGNLDAAGKIDIPEMPKVDAPTIEVPVVAKGDMTLDAPSTGSSVDVPVRTVDTAATVPVREPALVGSGGDITNHIGDGGHIGSPVSTPGHGGSALPDGPTTGGGDGGTGGGTDGPTSGGSSEAGHGWDPDQGDPALSDADYGPGFTRVDDMRGNTIDPNYGQPMAEHGRLGDQYLPPRLEDLPQDIRDLVTDPEAPFGRDAAGNPYSREDWEARYVDESNYLRYPGNEGAVVGRRLDFVSVEQFEAHYGDVLDRQGNERGGYLSLPGTTFEERALPPGSLRQPYLTMHLTGELPPNTVIEVSEVAPAFGRRGGGLQIRILDADGQAFTVSELRNQGIIELIGDTRWPAEWPRPAGGTTPHYQNWNSGSSE
jgi:hypothetical protein